MPHLFVQEACPVTEAKRIQASKLYDAYRYWCQRNGHKPLSASSVAKDWVRLGFDKKTIQGRKYYEGIQIDPWWEEERRQGDFGFLAG